MIRKIIHIVNNLDKVNFGVWNASVFASSYLKKKYSLHTILLVCSKKQKDNFHLDDVTIIYVATLASFRDTFILENQLDTSDCLFVSHGCWQMPTRIAYGFKKAGFKWIYTPHGMLEPWSLNQHKFKKLIYFKLFESRWTRKSDGLRAVSSTEKHNLNKLYDQPATVVENGVSSPEYLIKPSGIDHYLFMSRLHHKKGVLPLVKAWSKSFGSMYNKKLIIAGPDDGELVNIEPYLTGNIEYRGAVFGIEKMNLLNISHYFILPSLSEGFPTSVLEAMSYGLIPIISEGCNFPAVYAENIGYRVESNEEDISRILRFLSDKPFDKNLSDKNRIYITQNFSEAITGDRLFKLYSSVIS